MAKRVTYSSLDAFISFFFFLFLWSLVIKLHSLIMKSNANKPNENCIFVCRSLNVIKVVLIFLGNLIDQYMKLPFQNFGFVDVWCI